MPSAEYGDTIHWGHEEIRVGHGYQLERLVDGLTEQQWIERQLTTVYVELEEAARVRVAEGSMLQEEADWELAQCAELIRRRAGTLFGDIEAELSNMN